MLKKVLKTIKVVLLAPFVLIALLLAWFVFGLSLLIGTILPLTGVYVYSAIYRIWNT